MTNHLPLRAFKRKANTAIAVIGMNAHHVRTMFWARSVRCAIHAGKPEDKTDHLFFNEGAKHESAIMYCGDEHVQWYDVGFRVGPHIALQLFHEAHFFRRFN